MPTDEKLQEFARDLRRSFSGDIRLDRFSRLLYSTDASIYQIEPLGVLLPRSHDDVAAAVSASARYGLSVLSRGGGTSLAGQAVGSALVIDYSKYMNRILEVRLEEHCARVEPGVVLDQLNAHLKGTGRQFGPDVSTSNRATLGGMIGNNSCGSHSVLYGKMIDHVRELRVLLSSGIECRLSEMGIDEWSRKTANDNPEGRLYLLVDRLVRENRDEIRARFPKLMRHVSGYNLDSLVSEDHRNLCRLVVGSEGTLAAYTEAVVNLVPAPKCKVLDIVHFSDLVAAMAVVPEILTHRPAAIELLDKMLLDLTRLQPAFARRMTFVEGDPAAILIVEFYGNTVEELQAKIQRLDHCLRSHRAVTATVHAIRPDDQADVWALRKAGLGLLASTRGDSKPTAFVEDTAVPPDNLEAYVSRFLQILSQHGTRAGFYGHASVGCLHIRPLINLKESSQIQTMVSIAGAVKNLVVEFKGAMSGEHGDGLLRSHWNRELFGDRLYEAFRELKAGFDPARIMNPGKIVDAPSMTENLRYGPSYKAMEPVTHFDFSRDGGIARAIELCNGMGTCRKTDLGTMCPSYMVTREEEHSTRGRANALRAALSGRLPHQDFTSPRMHAALDLCLECKACKTECPANVDLAKLKSEFLAHYYARHGTPLRALLFGNIAKLSRVGSATAPLSNWILNSSVVRQSVFRLLGIHPSRRAPLFALETFRAWLRKHPPQSGVPGAPHVVLFNDTYINYNEPELGKAALKLLESTGARVSVPDVQCCGRPLISKGLLKQAKKNASRNVALLMPFVESGATIVGCEPSCLLTLRDEYPELVRTEEARRLAEKSLLLEEYLISQLDAGRWRPVFAETRRTVLLHGHCHQKSLVGTEPCLRLLALPPGFKASEIDSGCCGMAGSFGFEKEHYKISLEIGEMRLFPAVRAAPADAIILAAGTSCRQQILHATGRKAKHLAEVLADALVSGSDVGHHPAEIR